MNSAPLTLSDKLNNIIESMSGFVPEVLLAVLFLIVICIDLIWKRKNNQLVPWVASIGLIIILGLVLQQVDSVTIGSSFLNMLQHNSRESFFKIIFLLSGIFTIIMSVNSRELHSERGVAAELYSILIALILGLHLMVMSANLLMVYLSIELVSIASYIIASFSFNRKGTEGAIKYLLFGAVASGVMLYGISLLYGFTGTLEFTSGQFAANLSKGHPIAVAVAITFTLAGILFKVAAAPVHIWAPDVYEGAPVPVVAFFSVAPKAAGMALLVNFIEPDNFLILNDSIRNIFIAVTFLSIAIGNFSALWQQDLRRMLAYSSIAHTGFLLLCIVVATETAVGSMIFYLFIFLIMNFAAFILVQVVSDGVKSSNVNAFRGLGLQQPFYGVMFLVVMIGLTGLPPTAGFTAKLFVFSSLWESWQATQNSLLLYLLLFGLFNTVVSLFYYMKIPYYLFFKSAEYDLEITFKLFYKIIVFTLIFLLVFLFFKADWLINWIQLS